jgi:ABC-type multidrug transport system fused ATPase/permease subunit
MYSQKQFFTALVALLFTAQAAGSLFSLSPEITRAKTAASNVFRLLSFQPTILDQTDPDDKNIKPPIPSGTALDGVERNQNTKIEFERSSFSYSSNVEQTALEDITLTINHGQTVAFVGPSGAGKSSILALMERFHDPTGGQILFEGVDIREMNVRTLRRRLSLVPQDPELFPGTISYNIRLGASSKETITQDMVEAVAKQCGIHDFISSLPDGYNTECGSMSNSKLSGGQRQRLSLARALISDPEVLILDEPTSSLDAVSEQQVQDALKSASRGRTTIIVAHRLASVRNADTIVVFDSGRVVEQGTHSELVQLGGLYASMAKAQVLT